MELRRLLMEGEGAGAGSDDVTFSASLVSDKLTTTAKTVKFKFGSLKFKNMKLRTLLIFGSYSLVGI